MAKPLVPDELWEIIEPLLPPKPKSGRPRVPDHAALTGIIFVLKASSTCGGDGPLQVLESTWMEPSRNGMTGER